MNLRKLLEAGHEAQGVAKAAKEAANAGKLRIGSVGAICTDNEIRGVCHRVALLRKLGIEEKVGLHTRVMWGHGETSEINAERVLTAAGISFLGQELVELKIDDFVVSGHPDAIIEVDGVKHGVELKCIFSFNTAALVSLDQKPKNENFIQAATYSLATGLPWMLMYSNPNYAKGYHQKKYASVIPFYTVFYLEWRNGTAWYRHEDSDWVETLVTEEGIKDFYRLVHSEMEEKKELGPRPTGNYIDGTKAKYPDACGLCTFKEACADYDNNHSYDDWVFNCVQAVT